MKRTLFSAVLTGAILAGASVQASEPIKAIMMLGGDDRQVVLVRGYEEGQVWYGPSDTSKFGFKPRDIEKIIFDTRKAIDDDKIEELMEKRSYEEIIDMLVAALEPYKEYEFLPSNLTRYQAMLMELYYKVGDYDNSLVYSRLLGDSTRDAKWPPRCDEKTERDAYVYQGLALMDMKDIAGAEALFEERGWTQDLADDAPAGDLYITAKFLRMKEDYVGAIEMAAKVVAFNSQDPEWNRPGELLCARLYTELGMFESSEEVIREILAMYADTDEADEATKLKDEIPELCAAWKKAHEESED